jgi:hypothetical protein
MATSTIRHGARYSDAIVDTLYRRIADECAHLARPALIIDPFAGTGEKIAEHHDFQRLTINHRIEGIELEPAFIAADWVKQGNALHLPYQTGEVDIVFTSPSYGNRFADRHTPKDGSARNSYTFWLRHNQGVPIDDQTVQLHVENTGRHRFGTDYQQLHQGCYQELYRVMRPGGLLLLNVSNFMRNNLEVDAVSWHRDTLTSLGFVVTGETEIETRRMRYGANRRRPDSERLLIVRR